MFKVIPEIQSLVENASKSSEKLSLLSSDLVRIPFFKITLTIIIMRTLNDNLKRFFHLRIVDVLAIGVD